MWAATNKDGSQTWFSEKPKRGTNTWIGKLPILYAEVYGYFLKQTWNDEPIEFNIIPRQELINWFI